MRINLGCGKVVIPGWVNCDNYIEGEGILKVDLYRLPLPFDDGCADEVLLSHVLEHLNNKYELLMECHRILRQGGILHVKMPIHSNRVEHVSFYHQKNYFNTLCTNPGQNYGHDDFELVSIRKHVYPCRARIKDRYYRMLTWFHSLIFFEYEWSLRKR